MSLKRNETMEATQNRRFYLKYRVPPIWATYIGKRRTTFANAYAIKSGVLWRKCLGTHWELGEPIGNFKAKLWKPPPPFLLLKGKEARHLQCMLGQ
jgi:hypothetical protein